MTGFRARTLPTGLVAAIILAAVLTCTGATVGKEKASQDATTSKLGQIQTQTYDFKAAGKEMEYTLFVPSGYIVVAPMGYNSRGW